jgi:hypothetical protein
MLEALRVDLGECGVERLEGDEEDGEPGREQPPAGDDVLGQVDRPAEAVSVSSNEPCLSTTGGA